MGATAFRAVPPEDVETCKLHGGHSKDWIGQYGKLVVRHS